MNILDKNKYGNHENSFNLILKQKEEINGRITKVGIDYVRKISGKLNNEDFYDLRNSLVLRLESVFYHYEILRQLNISGKQRSYNHLGPFQASQTSLKQGFLFDSLIFNSVSFFDYLSCFISFIAFKNKKTQWQSIAQSSRSNTKFKESKLAKSIDETDRYFVVKLTQYRGELIHYENDKNEFSTSLDLKNNLEKINIFAPNNFVKKFNKELKHLDKKDLDINTIGIWILDLITSETKNILGEIENYIEENRIIEKGKEIITFKND